MKNFLLLPAVIILFLSGCCEKELPVQQKVMNVELKKNETWNYNFSSVVGKSKCKITSEAMHNAVSKLDCKNNYTYQPAKDYTGSDEVVITSAEYKNDKDNHCGCHQDNATHEIIIHFVIKGNEPGKHHRSSICPSF